MLFQLVLYILVNGRAKEAIEYYQEALNAEAEKRNESEKDLIAHSVIKIGKDKIMIADIIPELPFQNGNQVSICITTSEITSARQLYESLKNDGKVLIELNEIYFSPAYDMVTDKFCSHFSNLH